jgi:hypothetical protein
MVAREQDLRYFAPIPLAWTGEVRTVEEVRAIG